MPEEKPILTPEVSQPEIVPSTPLEKPEIPEGTLEVKPEGGSEKTPEKYGEILSSVVTPSVPQSEEVVATDAQDLAPLQDADSTVQKLVALAQTKGVAHAVAVAQKLNDLYVIDTMHDELADKFGEALAEKGLIETV